MPDPTIPEESKKTKVFKLELTPLKPVINPDVPLSMELKNTTDKIQAVVVEVKSYLFELTNPRATAEPCSQVYHKLEPGGTLSFKVRFAKKPIVKGTGVYRIRVEELEKNPEGWLKVRHRTSSSMDDTDLEWGYRDDEEGDYTMPGHRVVSSDPQSSDGYVEMELICEKETRWTKKMREALIKGEEPKKCSIM